MHPCRYLSRVYYRVHSCYSCIRAMIKVKAWWGFLSNRRVKVGEYCKAVISSENEWPKTQSGFKERLSLLSTDPFTLHSMVGSFFSVLYSMADGGSLYFIHQYHIIIHCPLGKRLQHLPITQKSYHNSWNDSIISLFFVIKSLCPIVPLNHKKASSQKIICPITLPIKIPHVD